MKRSSLNLSLLTGVALFAFAVSAPALAQTSLPSDSPAEMSMTTPEAPVVPSTSAPASPAAPAVSPVTVPSTMTPTTSDASSDPAVSAVLDRLKQDSTPLSISDMSAAQDALARLNLLSEIETKLSQIEETRQKRQFGNFSGMNMGAMPLPEMGGAGMMPMNNAFGNFGKSTSSSDPQIVSISGAGGTYRAILQVGSRTINAKSGTVLPDGSKVTNISSNGVSVSKKGKTSKLSFAEAAAEQ